MTKEASNVCKYWTVIIKGNLVNIISDPEKKRKITPSRENDAKLVFELKSRRTKNSKNVIKIIENDYQNVNGDTQSKVLKWNKTVIPKSWENDEIYNRIKSFNIMKASNSMHKIYNGSNSRDDLGVKRVQWSNSTKDDRSINTVVVRGIAKNSGTYQSANGFDNNDYDKKDKNDDNNKNKKDKSDDKNKNDNYDDNGNGDVNDSEVQKEYSGFELNLVNPDSIENKNVQNNVNNNSEKKNGYNRDRGNNGKKKYSEDNYNDEGIEYEGDYEKEEEEMEEDDTPRITIRSRKNKQNGKNGNGDSDILSKYGIREEDGEMKQIMLDDDEKSVGVKENSPTLIGNDDVNKEDNITASNSSPTTDSPMIEDGEVIQKNDAQKNDEIIIKKSEEVENGLKKENGKGKDKKNTDDKVDKKYDHLLTHVKDIRSEKQLTDLIEFIQDGYTAIEQADNDKRKSKRRIKGTKSFLSL